MDTAQLDELRAQVEAERDTARTELQRLGADPEGDAVAIQGIDDNFADSAAATAERAETLALVEQARERLGAANAALASMDAGTYGRCRECGEPIPPARLEARPLALRCVECARAGA